MLTRDIVISKYKAGTTLAVAGAAAGVSAERARQVIEKFAPELRQQRLLQHQQRRQQLDAAVLVQRRNGASIEHCKKLGTSSHHIKQLLRQAAPDLLPTPPTKYDNAMLDAVVALRRDGKSRTEIAAALNLGDSVVTRILKRAAADLIGPPHERPMTPARRAAVIKYYRSGRTMREAGALFGISAHMVSHILHQFAPGLSRGWPQRSLAMANRNAAVIASYRDGLSWRRCAQLHKLGVSHVRYIIIHKAPQLLRPHRKETN